MDVFHRSHDFKVPGVDEFQYGKTYVEVSVLFDFCDVFKTFLLYKKQSKLKDVTFSETFQDGKTS